MSIIKGALTLLVIFLFIVTSCKEESTVQGCIDESKINSDAICTRDYTPVCGCDGKTYGNACTAENAGLLSWIDGECDK